MIGYNFRMGEIEAAIGIEQLKKLKKFIKKKQIIGNQLNSGLKQLHGLVLPTIKSNNSHIFYLYPLKLDLDIINIDKKNIVKALEAEGVQGLISEYQNIHLLPIFQNKIAYGSKGYPWTNSNYKGKVSYDKGITPIAEKIFDENFLNLGLSLYKLNQNKLKRIVKAFNKIWSNFDKLESI